MSSSRISIILQSVQELGQPVRVSGTTPSSQALMITRFVRERREPVVVLCATDDAAAELASDIETLSAELDGAPISVCQLPSWEQSAYSPIAPSIRTRLARISCLSSLVQGVADTPPAVITTTLAASVQATLPPELLRASSISIAVDASVESRETLTRKLVDAGYLRSDTVEDPGTFGVRGDIVDVYPPNRDQPLRIELFGDLVERIRAFDPATQRALDDVVLKNMTIPPAREVLITPENSRSLRERLKTYADDLGVSRAVRDPVLASVYEGMYPDHSDTWAPFAYETTASLWHYLSEPTRVIWSDELTCQQEWDRFLEEQNRLAGSATETGVIVPAPKELFRLEGDSDAVIKARTSVYLDRIELANLESLAQEEPPPESPDEPRVGLRHRVFVKSNGDLSKEGKQALGELESKFKLWNKQGFRSVCFASTESQRERIRFLLEERGFACQLQGPPLTGTITLLIGSLSAGFRWPTEGLVVLTENEILGTRRAKKRAPRGSSGSAAKDWSGLQALADLSVGDAVVHVDHGIGRYQGLIRLELLGAPSDFLLIEYANKDKLYLPVYRLNVIQKYVGAGESVALDKLGSQQFAKAKDKVREAVKRLAIDLVKLYAERKIRPGVAFSPRDAEFREFEAKFPFDETPDQLKAIDDVLADLESGRAMDRLVCGDVGYGKTEVAIRAAFRAVTDGKQVAVLVPTTVLAHQHEQSLRARLKDYPITIESISRFKSSKEQKSTLERLAHGKLDIVIGTHRLLSRDVKFHDLGLVIVDEEHRFGVEHKEKLKALKVNTHVLTLTATPIPRTLHMALSGLRDISLINTPPVDRLPIRTYVSKHDDSIIKRAVEFELSRGGQVFYLHNRIQSIYESANRVRELVPSAQIVVGHGQMPESELEDTMIRFYQRQANVLVCTTIIESGIDLPNANTILIDRADSLGLAQLYQIRGRVGRGQQRAYSYLFIPAEGAVTDDAKKRLEVIQKFVELGSGFSIASHDLEIRGGGDLLGPQQSGHINAVGFDLYTELLEEAIHELQGQPADEASHREPEIKAPFPSFLADQYVPDVHQRLSLYRRFSAAREDSEVDRLEEELRDRFGPPPVEAQNLLWLIRIKVLLKRIGIDTLTVGPEKASLVPGPGSRLDPARAIALVSAHPHQYQLTPDSKLVVKVPTGSLRDLFFGLEGLFKRLGTS